VGHADGQEADRNQSAEARVDQQGKAKIPADSLASIVECDRRDADLTQTGQSDKPVSHFLFM
jgi:hypothetical protein